MSKPRKKNKIKKGDYSRVLVTETLPHETPIMFSNEGLYRNVVATKNSDPVLAAILDILVFGSGLQKLSKFTIPFHYKIRKSSTEFRQLSLIHPLSQWRIREFYKRYEDQIINYCLQSPASIRAPHKIASAYYSKSSWDSIQKFKRHVDEPPLSNSYGRFGPTHFAYRGYDRLYKFFKSGDYFRLEKSHRVLRRLDVSRCFDSIYTHSLSWALKDKLFTKKHAVIESTFAQSFDALMRHTNHNETNGIVIGPEISRIFAELLFQAIDARTIAKLKESPNHYGFGTHYEYRRYVDDVFIFARDEQTCRTVYECYSDVLTLFNLHANTAKFEQWFRPFVTKKSRITSEATERAEEFVRKFLVEDEQTLELIPRKIHHRGRLTRSFIDSIKAICSYNQVDYDELASYLVSFLTERVKKVATNDLSKAKNGAITESCVRT